MTTQITIDSFELQGFRAYLQQQTFSLRNGNRPMSLAIFAPNAKGKIKFGWMPLSISSQKMLRCNA